MFSTKIFASFFLVLVIILGRIDRGNADINTNCKTKVRNMWLKYCVTDGVRLKRDVFNVHSVVGDHHDREKSRASADEGEISPQNPGISTESLPGNSRKSLGREIITAGSSSEEYKRKIRRPRSPGLPPLMSGDDLGIGLSSIDLEQLYDEIIERLPRAAKNKDETMRMITAYAASCCNENSNDADCSDPANFIHCP